jgi:hypothetical protein
MSNVPEIIEALGGKDQVSRLTGAKPNAIRAWRRIGIPYKHWQPLLQQAQAVGAAVDAKALAATRPPASAA